MAKKQELNEIQKYLQSLNKVPEEIVARVAAEKSLKAKSIPMDAEPPCKVAPKLVKDITTESTNTVGSHHWQYSLFAAYVRRHLALRQADLKWLKRVRAGMASQAGSKKDADANLVSVDQLVTDIEYEVDVLMERAAWYDDCTKALSREITRRQTQNLT